MNRNFALDVLKFILALMVVGLHAHFLGNYSAQAEFLARNGIFRIAVPIFVIINGFYFYPVLSSERSRYWLKKIFYLYLFWMAFYSYFWFRPTGISFSEMTKVIQKLMIGHHQLWYLPGILGAAAILILLKRCRGWQLVSIIISTFVLGVFVQYAGNYHVFSDFALDELFNETWFHRNFLLFSFPFFCLGYLINKHRIYEAFSNQVWLALSLIGVVLLVGESYLNFVYQPYQLSDFDNFISLIIVCPAVFLWVYNLNISGESKNIALYSSAIFYIHSFVLVVVDKLLAPNETFLALWGAAASIIAAYFIIEIDKKIKIML